jgi:glucokinase
MASIDESRNLLMGVPLKVTNTKNYLKHVIVCRIINDFVAQGYGCLTLNQSEALARSQGGRGVAHHEAPKCVGAGTGLGQCYLTQGKAANACFPSEGGHVEYAPPQRLKSIWKYLSDKFSSIVVFRSSESSVASDWPTCTNTHEFPER